MNSDTQPRLLPVVLGLAPAHTSERRMLRASARALFASVLFGGLFNLVSSSVWVAAMCGLGVGAFWLAREILPSPVGWSRTPNLNIGAYKHLFSIWSSPNWAWRIVTVLIVAMFYLGMAMGWEALPEDFSVAQLVMGTAIQLGVLVAYGLRRQSSAVLSGPARPATA